MTPARPPGRCHPRPNHETRLTREPYPLSRVARTEQNEHLVVLVVGASKYPRAVQLTDTDNGVFGQVDQQSELACEQIPHLGLLKNRQPRPSLKSAWPLWRVRYLQARTQYHPEIRSASQTESVKSVKPPPRNSTGYVPSATPGKLSGKTESINSSPSSQTRKLTEETI